MHTINKQVPSPATLPPVLGFAAFSGTGKTTLLAQLIPLLARRQVRVALIKHAHHEFDIDTPGKDSYILRRAGAGQVLIASDRRSALMTERVPPREPTLDELVQQLDPGAIDLVLVEGFRHLPFAKIELHRSSLGHPLLCAGDRHIIAVASDAPLSGLPVPNLDLNEADTIASFIINWLRETHGWTGLATGASPP